MEELPVKKLQRKQENFSEEALVSVYIYESRKKVEILAKSIERWKKC